MKHEEYTNEKGEKCFRIVTESEEEERMLKRLIKNKIITELPPGNSEPH